MAKADGRRAGMLAVNIVRYILAAALLLLLGISVREHLTAPQEEESLFAGKGTREDPYLISSEADLALLAETVNAGTTFEGNYFVQARDLDLAGYENWIPIGSFESGHTFAGFYNGNGHVISNLKIHGEGGENGNVGLFGVLAGVVYNLGIESGEITGTCIGSIASHAGSANAMIVNCYNKASMEGARCGGIADNFASGKILCCWNEGKISGSVAEGAITSYTAGTVFGCLGLQELVNEYFAGDMFWSEVCTKIDPEAMQGNLKEAKRRYDLQYLEFTEVHPASA